MPILMIVFLAATMLFSGCDSSPDKETPTTPETPVVVVPPVGPATIPVPSPSTVSYWKPGPIKSFQILHFESLKELQKKLQKVDVVTVELEHLRLYEGKKAVEMIHAQGSKAICYTSEVWAEWAYDKDTICKEGMGKEQADWPGIVWLDPRKQCVKDVIKKRAQECAKFGVDAVEFDCMDQHANAQEAGIKISASENVMAQIEIAGYAHELGMGVVQKNAGDIAKDLVGVFDMVYSEGCFRFHECDNWDVFAKAKKPVMILEYGILHPCKSMPGTICRHQSDYFE